MTLTHAPVAFPHDEAIAADSTLIIHRRRRRRWWPVVLGVAVAGALVAVGLDQIKAPALSFDGGATVWRLAPGDETAVGRVDNVLGSEVTVGFERSGTFSADERGSYVVQVGNYGARPVGYRLTPTRGG